MKDLINRWVGPVIGLLISFLVAAVLVLVPTAWNAFGPPSYEIEPYEYREVKGDLLSVPKGDAEPIYSEAQALMKQRVAECMTDGKITKDEYQNLYKERQTFITESKFRNAKQEVQEALK